MKTIQHPKPNKKRACHVWGCKNYDFNPRSEASLHRFPVDEKLKKLWSSVLKIYDITDSTRVCTLHFRKSDYIPYINSSNVNRLKKGVIPSLNLPKSPMKQEKYMESESSEIEENTDNDEEEELENKEISKTNTKKKSILDYINTDIQLKEFCGIPSFKLLHKIVKGTKSVAKNKNSDLSMSLTHRIMLIFLKIRLNLSLVCLSALFQLNEDVCKTYFNQTVHSVRALLYHTIENNPENGEMMKILMQIHYVKDIQNTVFY